MDAVGKITIINMMERIRTSLGEEKCKRLVMHLKVQANNDINKSSMEGNGGRYVFEFLDDLLIEYFSQKD